MCKQPLHPFLQELETKHIAYVVDRNQKLYLIRNLPKGVDTPPPELIPAPILQLHDQYMRGELQRDTVGVAKLHDIRKRLRRYNLVVPPMAKGTKRKSEPTEEQLAARRLKRAAYLRDWRRRNSTSAVIDNSIVC